MDFKTITDILFKNKNRYRELSDKDKELMFFIVNRYLSKKYPKQSQFFNFKTTDKATGMDIWFQFLSKENQVPFWYWKGATKKKDPDMKDWKIFYEYYNLDISINDMHLLCEIFSSEVKEEIKRLKKL